MPQKQAKWTSITTDRTVQAIWSINYQTNAECYAHMIREIDASAIDRLRSNIHAAGYTKPSYTAVITKAAAIMLEKHPILNRAILGPPLFRRVVQLATSDIAVAADTSEPGQENTSHPILLRNVAQRSCADLTEELQQYGKEKLHNNPEWQTFKKITSRLPLFVSKLLLRAPWYFPDVWIKTRGSACWVNSPAKEGVDLVFTTWPWFGTFSFGLVTERPIVLDGVLAVRRTIPLLFVFDVRIISGAPGARIFHEYAQLLLHADEHQALFMAEQPVHQPQTRAVGQALAAGH